MNIVQARHISDNSGKVYTYKVPKDTIIAKGTLLLVENKISDRPEVVIAVTDSALVSDNVLDMIMRGQAVQSKVLGMYHRILMFKEDSYE